MQLQQLIDALSASFNHEELREIALVLGFDHENISGQTKKAYARELIRSCEQNDKLEELLNQCRQRRPNRQWPEYSQLQIEKNIPSAGSLSQTKSDQVFKLNPVVILISVAVLFLGIVFIFINMQDSETPFISISNTPPTNEVEATILPTTTIIAAAETPITPVWETRNVFVDLQNNNCDQAINEEIKNHVIQIIETGVILRTDDNKSELEAPDARIRLECSDETSQLMFELATTMPIFHTVTTPIELELFLPKSFSSDDVGRIIRGLIYYAQGNFASVINSLESVIQQETTVLDPYVVFIYANSYLLTANYGEALQIYDDLLQQVDDVPLLMSIHNNRGVAILNQTAASSQNEDATGIANEGQQAFEQALLLHMDEEPTSQIEATIIANQWFAFLESGEYELAEETCQNPLLSDSNNPLANVCAGASIVTQQWFSSDCNEDMLQEAEKLYFANAQNSAINLIDVYYWQGRLQWEMLSPKCNFTINKRELAAQKCQDMASEITTLRQAGYAPLHFHMQMEEVMNNLKIRCQTFNK